MKNTSFTSNPVGRVGTVLVRPVSRPKVEQKTEVCLGRGGLDTSRKNHAGLLDHRVGIQ